MPVGAHHNQILQILPGPAASNGKITLLNLISHLVQTIIAICMLHTSLRRVQKPTYPDFKHHIHKAAFKPQDRDHRSAPRLLWNRGFWGWGNTSRWTHANLSVPCLLASPQNLQQQWGGLRSSLKIGIKHGQPRVVKKVGLLGRG